MSRRPPLVLAYHGLADVDRRLDPHNLMVASHRVEAQLDRLRRRGYGFVALTELVARLRAGDSLRGLCSLTWDDGTAELAERLPPLLERFEAPGTVFVCPGLPGAPHPDMPAAAGVRLLEADEVRGLAQHPLVRIGSHTNRHTSLAAAGSEEAYAEMADSRRALEDLCQTPVEAFAYPGCAYSAACPAAAHRAGYAVAVTCGPRGGWSPYELRRESIDSLDGRVSFALKSRGAYWSLWGSAPGRVVRRATRTRRHGDPG